MVWRVLGVLNWQVKHCLKKVLGLITLDLYQLQTVTQEIELILNSRPLGFLYGNDMEQILTLNQSSFNWKKTKPRKCSQ